MKGISLSAALCLALSCIAGAQSMAVLMEEADLVAAARIDRSEQSDRFELFSLLEVKTLRGEADQGGFQVACFKDVDLHCAKIIPGERMLLFLKRMNPETAGLFSPLPAYMPLAGELSCLRLDDPTGEALLEGVGRYGELLRIEDENARERAVAELLILALEAGSEPLLYSALHEATGAPGSLDFLGVDHRQAILELFQASEPASRIRYRLLCLLAEWTPPELPRLVEEMVRSPEGRFCLDPAAAILSHLDDAETPGRLVEQFDALGKTERNSVVYVLGRLGGGRGAAALCGLISDHFHEMHAALADSLRVDGSEEAVAGLAELARSNFPPAALSAVESLYRIDTAQSRAVLSEMLLQSDLCDEVRQGIEDLVSSGG